VSNLSFAQRVIDFHFNLEDKWKLPKGVELIQPFTSKDTKDTFKTFYSKYFNDYSNRYFLFGINPGRFGAGVTGVPFTDPKILEELCDIPNPFKKKNELSAIFVYEFIEALGGIEQFYSHFYVTSLCPLGFIKEGKNYNYYDEKALFEAVKKHMVSNIQTQITFGCNTDVAFCMGIGKNMKYFKMLNDEYSFFKKIVPLPHPRWVMQYRRKSKQEHIDAYVEKLGSVLG